jgi:hypothetical protein
MLSALLLGLLNGRGMMELRGKLLGDSLTESGFQELAGVPARRSGKTLGCDGGFALGADENFYGLQAAPPLTCTVSFTEPSARVLSETRCPLRLLSIFTFSTAYA